MIGITLVYRLAVTKLTNHNSKTQSGSLGNKKHVEGATEKQRDKTTLLEPTAPGQHCALHVAMRHLSKRLTHTHI